MGKQRNYFPNAFQRSSQEGLNPPSERGGAISASLGHDADMCQQASDGGGRGRLRCGAGSDMSCAHVHASSIKSCSHAGPAKVKRAAQKWTDGRKETWESTRRENLSNYEPRHRTDRIYPTTNLDIEQIESIYEREGAAVPLSMEAPAMW